MSPFFFFRTSGVIFISFFDENPVSKRNSPDVTPHFAASHLGLLCLPMKNKKDARRMWINEWYEPKCNIFLANESISARWR